LFEADERVAGGCVLFDEVVFDVGGFGGAEDGGEVEGAVADFAECGGIWGGESRGASRSGDSGGRK